MDSFASFLILFVIACFVLMIIVGYRQHKYGTGHKVKMQLTDDDTGRVCHSATGHSYGSAAVELCFKLYSSAPSTKISSIRERIDSMNKVINQYRGRMKEQDLRRCEDYRNRLEKRVRELRQQEESRQKAAEAERLKKQQEQRELKRKQDAKRRQREKAKEQARIEKEKAMSEQKRYIAAQRRLMTDSLRYDVMHRDGFQCVLCGASPSKDPNIVLHVDHIVPLAKGGKTEMSNLRTLCERCNLGKRDKIENKSRQPIDSLPVKKPKGSNEKLTSGSDIRESQDTTRKGTDILSMLKEREVTYIDNRDVGGNLWVIGGHELDTLMKELQENGYRFYFREQGGKASKGRPAWFITKQESLK